MADEPDPARVRRYQLAIQRERFVGYCATGVLALALVGMGSMHATFPSILLLLLVCFLNIAVFYLAAGFDAHRKLGIDPTPAWLMSDVVFTTVAVYLSGGIDSPWYIMYLNNTLLVAFVMGPAGVILVSLANTAAYLALLLWIGQIHLVDGPFLVALGRMILLNTTLVLGLRGILELQNKRRLIKRLQQEESRKVEQLLQLTAELDQRTQALAEANRQVRETDRIKSAFLANMSHELRTPLNSIIGFSDVVMTRLEGHPDPRIQKFLKNINNSGTHLLGLINDILDLSKIEAGKLDLHPEPTDVGAIVDGVAAVMKGLAAPKDVRIHLIPPDTALPLLEVDPSRLRQVLFNLLSNAIKFSPEHAVVTLTQRALGATASPLGTEAVELSVADQGIGIDPKDHALVFEEFRQVDSVEVRKQQGTGLGLALVRRLVEMHGGRVTLESQLGQGARFTVLLPFRPPQTSPETPPPTEPADNRPVVLVVEDETPAFERICAALAKDGYRFVHAREGEQALALAAQVRPALITLDVVLAGLDGLEVLRRLKLDPAISQVPVVVVSITENRELGLALGADDFFQKPVQPELLAQRVAELVGGRRPSRLLLIDDDPDVHALLGPALEARGYAVEHAHSGAQGLERAGSQPDLVILDLLMAGMDGFEVAARLKAEPATQRIPILVLTSKDLSREERAALRGQAGALLSKSPRAQADLAAAVERLLRGPRA